MRSYELMFVLDPRLSEDDAKALTNEFKDQVTAAGAEIVKAEHWGRRKLAYEIKKLKEGRYVLFFLTTPDGSHGLAGVERRMEQHDQVLRYMLVRTDEELKRAGLPLPTADEEAEAEADEGEGEEKASAAPKAAEEPAEEPAKEPAEEADEEADEEEEGDEEEDEDDDDEDEDDDDEEED